YYTNIARGGAASGTQAGSPQTATTPPRDQGADSGGGSGNAGSGFTFKTTATSFQAMGEGYGGKGSCGWSLEELRQTKGTTRFVALVGGQNGMFKNRANCGKWIQVQMGPKCTSGISKGECQGGSSTDQYTGATLNFIVADECPTTQNNQPCIADPNHLDLSRAALTEFTKDGKNLPLNDGIISQRQVFWKFIQ
ncbi:MAG: hypothetical protein HQK54_17385, partial [Oligoflexales bacterium]|nr:hypothetical protein [Oligoflexales bacterium]